MTKRSAPKTVTLVDPNGREYQATSPTEITNLVFGNGYSLKDTKKSVDQAVADLGDAAVVPPTIVSAPVAPAAAPPKTAS